MIAKISNKPNSEYFIKRIFVRFFIGFLAVPMYMTLSHPVSNPGSFSLARVSHFPFYQKLSNPCGMTQALPTDSTNTQAADETVFTQDFLMSMGLAINLTLDALEDLQNTNEAAMATCNGISLASLPETPAMKTMSELKLMSQSYKSGIFLTAHLHIVSLDRERGDETNEVPDEDPHNEDDSIQEGDFLCENESTNYVALVQELTSRMENLLCTVVTGANLEQRASFRRPLQHLEITKIFRYHNSCTALQTRDCIVFHETKEYLLKLRNKFKKLILQHQQQRLRSQLLMLAIERNLGSYGPVHEVNSNYL
ncbi:unnamed protein product [Allacma fusca]|uniref:Uncharacterized protein n=1 Tax=Allacma fusca TaxID=39272 RepID=A0A8J2NM81_9HEXA|nr:unnamed protein product [Allacma fusca]